MEYNLTMKIKTIIISKNGGPEVLELKESNIERPSQDEVLIEHVAIGLNFIDIYHRAGINPLPLPFIPGLEGSGVIEKLGRDVSDFRLGDRVAYCTGSVGSYCLRRSFPADKLVPVNLLSIVIVFSRFLDDFSLDLDNFWTGRLEK